MRASGSKDLVSELGQKAAEVREHFGFVLTVFEPRWHGLARWQLDFHEPTGGSLIVVSPFHAGFVRRRGVVYRRLYLNGYRRRGDCKTLARSL